MVEKGSIVVLRTKNAIYETCQIVAISKANVTVTYCAGMKRNRATGEFHMESPVVTIPKRDILSISERL